MRIGIGTALNLVDSITGRRHQVPGIVVHFEAISKLLRDLRLVLIKHAAQLILICDGLFELCLAKIKMILELF